MTRSSTLLVALALTLVGCDGKVEKAPSEADKTDAAAKTESPDQEGDKAEGDEAQAASADDTPAASEACSGWATAVCDKAGKTASVCTMLQELAPVLPDEACKAGAEHVDTTVERVAQQRAVCNTLVDKLCAELGTETKTCKMVKEQTDTFPPEKCKGMMDQYDGVLAELQAMEAQNKPIEDAVLAELTAGDAPAFGPEDAKVSIIEFSDFQCPYCSRAAAVVSQIKEKYGDKTRFVFRQFPLSFHKQAHLASQAALAANDQGKFWEFHDLLFEHQQDLQPEDLKTYAEQVGLDMAKFDGALDDKTHASRVDADIKLGEKVYVRGTPTMFVNGVRVDNPTDFGAVSKAIEDALAKG